MLRKNLMRFMMISMATVLVVGFTACGKKISDSTNTQPAKETMSVYENNNTNNITTKTFESKADKTEEVSKDNADNVETTENEAVNEDKTEASVENVKNPDNNEEDGNADYVFAESTTDTSDVGSDNNSNSDDNGGDGSNDTTTVPDTSTSAPVEPSTEAPTQAPTEAPTEAPRATKTVTKNIYYYDSEGNLFDSDSITYVAYVDTGLPVSPTYYTGNVKKSIPRYNGYTGLYYLMPTLCKVTNTNVNDSYFPEDGLDVSKYSGDIKLYTCELAS